LGREAGVLLGKAGVADATDATVVAIAATGDRVLSSDPGDLGKLAGASHRSMLVVPC
jgi:predicted nuclease of predicted toxin-antitoxin system